jgi:predicted deoxyguanosinetriphosphate triphosphohydrolase
MEEEREPFFWMSTKRLRTPKEGDENGSGDYRDDFDRDLGRIVHSTCFRRLQGKTQVWAIGESDYFRTRLTHSIEAAQIGRILGKMVMKKSEKITEYSDAEKKALSSLPNLVMACCFAHDLGHPPFGHDGAEVLKRFAAECYDKEGGETQKTFYDDNAQNIRILCKLEDGGYNCEDDGYDSRNGYDSRKGLNLTCALLDGILKYQTRASDVSDKSGFYDEEEYIISGVKDKTGTRDKRSPIAMLVEVADDIAYVNHDLQDGMRAHLITPRIFWRELDLAKTIANPTVSKESKLLIDKLIKNGVNFEGFQKHIEELHDFVTEVEGLLGLDTSLKICQMKNDDFRRFQKKFFAKLINEMVEEVGLQLDNNQNLKKLLNVEYEKNDKLNMLMPPGSKLNNWILFFKYIEEKRIFNVPNVKAKKAACREMLMSYLKRFENLVKEGVRGIKETDKVMFQALPSEYQEKLENEESKDVRLRVILDYVSGMTDVCFLSQASAFYDPENIKMLGFPR